MAVKTFPTNDPLTNKLYAKRLSIEAITQTYFGRFLGEGPNNAFQLRTETQKAAGDRITYGLRVKLSGAGVQGGNTLEGNEEAFITYDDAIIIDELRHAVRVRAQGTIEQQRVPFDLREEGLELLAQWWADRNDEGLANQLSGNTVQQDTRFTGNQGVIAASAANIFRPNAVANDETLGASDLFTIDLINTAVEKAKTLEPLIRPIRTMGQDFYLCFLHPYQVTDLRNDATTAGNWYSIQQDALRGGEISGNPIFTGALGVFNQTILHEWNRLPLGVNSGAPTTTSVPNTRRAVFCGAQAACCAYGQANGPSRYKWAEELFDYAKELGIAAGANMGIKKTVFNNQDFATIVIPTFAQAH